MITDFWPIIIHALFGIAFSVFILSLAHLIRPKLRESDSRPDTFECGIPYLGDAKGMVNVKFYMIAVLFILFDIEAIFLFPWAVAFKNLKAVGIGGFALLEMFLFLSVLLLGYLYILRKGGLDWEDLK